MIIATLIQSANLQATRAAEWVDSMVALLDTPAPFSPLTEYMLILSVIWWFAKRKEPEPNFDQQAQDVLEHKYQQGELTKEAFDKFRQDMSLRSK